MYDFVLIKKKLPRTGYFSCVNQIKYVVIRSFPVASFCFVKET